MKNHLESIDIDGSLNLLEKLSKMSPIDYKSIPGRKVKDVKYKKVKTVK
jgi:hypothetical protein